MSATRLTRDPLDKRDNARDYQNPPEDHKNPSDTEAASIKTHIMVMANTPPIIAIIAKVKSVLFPTGFFLLRK